MNEKLKNNTPISEPNSFKTKYLQNDMKKRTDTHINETEKKKDESNVEREKKTSTKTSEELYIFLSNTNLFF